MKDYSQPITEIANTAMGDLYQVAHETKDNFLVESKLLRSGGGSFFWYEPKVRFVKNTIEISWVSVKVVKKRDGKFTAITNHIAKGFSVDGYSAGHFRLVSQEERYLILQAEEKFKLVRKANRKLLQVRRSAKSLTDDLKKLEVLIDA